ncbi:hypothetical protein Taro_051332 [Colocasia esculenta]|uniref:NB-ARC domain-containing protein n=1 Tax=Colocasia esculenta TaxID=4460 RepID=A0A843XGG3_COLES|nr:hypothetical protein [Colocasia esculenta]
MAVEVVHFLMSKFTDGLQLQGENDATAILFERRFQEARWELEKRISSAVPLDTTNLLRELLYDLNDVLVECRTLSRRRADRRRRRRHSECIGLCCFLRDLWFRYRTKKRLLTIMQSLRTISDAGEAGAMDEIGKAKSVEFDRWTSPAVDMSRIHGFREQALAVEEVLVENGDRGQGFTAVGVVGMGGVGKTTLAQMVFNGPSVRRHFHPRLWVCMSQTLEPGKDARKETVKRALLSLGLEEEVIRSATAGKSESQSLEVLTFMLHLQLLGKRYLIVFDDVWSTDEWYQGLDRGSAAGDSEWGDQLAYGLPKGDGGGVIVTGRAVGAVKGMVGGGDTRSLLPLESREACWSIFVDAFAKGSGHAGDQAAALRGVDQAQIVDKCCGLPLAARTMGEIMSEIMTPSSGSSSRSGWTSSNISSATNSGILE